MEPAGKQAGAAEGVGWQSPDAVTGTTAAARRRGGGRVHPGRPLAPMAVAAATIGTWWVVAHNSGAGWVQALGDVVFGVLFIGIVGPSAALARAKVAVAQAPMDATAGLPADVRIRASTRVRVRAVDPRGPEAFIGPVRGRRPAEDAVALVPRHRGVYRAVTVDIATAAPFGLQWWTRRTRLALPAPLHVAPRRGRPDPLPRQGYERQGRRGQPAPTDTGQPRGVRPYRPGDDRRHVHWPATAHAADLMVREMEEPAAEPVTLTVILPPEPEAAERVAERALGTVVALLERGVPVLLATTEPAGPVVGEVADRRAAARRLAGAVSRAGAGGDGPGISLSP